MPATMAWARSGSTPSASIRLSSSWGWCKVHIELGVFRDVFNPDHASWKIELEHAGLPAVESAAFHLDR